MYGNRRKAFLVSAVLVGGAMLMTACQDGDADAAQGSTSAAPAGHTDTATGGDQSGGKGTASVSVSDSGSGSSDSGKVAKCRTDGLKITATDNTIGGDPDLTVVVAMKNTGAECAMSGYAGVDLKTNAGPLSATRTGQEPVSFTLKTGESTFFPINYPANDTGGSGIRITGLLVTPPNETKTAAVQWPGAASLPISENGSTPVKIGPLGSAGQGGAQ
ncbi:DUF4232 domain-containing protein [Streptomyces sp. NBC_00304]|uniref:DUF4232 domain-containing protein n=1 Tax=Streptomyces sp. NBC_00304 TaxID=2975706 RepID=UPI002E2938BF|nr:DUF4232 domain-containing protein [Streptomyces sp. NBC_00304]